MNRCILVANDSLGGDPILKHEVGPEVSRDIAGDQCILALLLPLTGPDAHRCGVPGLEGTEQPDGADELGPGGAGGHGQAADQQGLD